MAAVQLELASSNNGLATVTLTYDDTTLAWASVTFANNDTVPHTVTAKLGPKSWSFTQPAGATTSHSVPHNVALAFTADATQTPPLLYQANFTLAVN